MSNLENRVGNIKFTGDARLRYRYSGGSKGSKNDKAWDYRVRIRGAAKVNERVTATLGISSDNRKFSENGPASDTGAIADVINFAYQANKNLSFQAGRTSLYVLGGKRSYGFQYGDIFDRVEGQYQNDNLLVTAGYGKFKKGGNTIGSDTVDAVKTAYGEVEGFFGNGSAVGVYYNNFSTADGVAGGDNEKFKGDDLWGAYVSINAGSKWNFLANYETVDLTKKTAYSHDDSADVWIGKITYGKTNIAKPHSWKVWIEYLDAEDGANLTDATWAWRNWGQKDNFSSWGVGLSYVVAKNLTFNAMQSFGTDVKANQPDSSAVESERTRAEFVLAF